MATFRKRPRFRSIVILASLVLIAAGGVCQGWWPYGLSYSGWAPGLFARSSDLERLPYYSLFPPVYYSHPVPRTYGYNPFAHLPELKTILEIQHASPQVVTNPYVRSTAGREVFGDSRADGPLLVRNPFVDRVEKTALDKCGEIANLAAPSK
jgi:hypothetical protein